MEKITSWSYPRVGDHKNPLRIITVKYYTITLKLPCDCIFATDTNIPFAVKIH